MSPGRRPTSWRALAQATDGAAVLGGVAALGTTIAAHRGGTLVCWALLVGGIGGITASVAMLWSPFAAVALLATVVSWAVAEELIEEMLDAPGTVRLHQSLAEAWLAALGVSAVLVGTGLLLWPGTRSLALVWPIGAYAVTCGTCALAIALRGRSRTGDRR
ncbi:MAG TPA: hypothetical protein VGR62_22795 [Candidatus Binatia bacterium]|jgi:uncharacterized membrane protein HdeD (DUF308 family)|nr:hypothetical protein [Candidatus Binatia bacterium]